jgi:hypothetical protein
MIVDEITMIAGDILAAVSDQSFTLDDNIDCVHADARAHQIPLSFCGKVVIRFGNLAQVPP